MRALPGGAKWAIVIFAYGISNVAAVIAYKVNIEKASLTLMPVWAPAVLFAVPAPLFFTLPLFLFTRQLFRAKRRALAAYRERARRHAESVEARWLGRHAAEPPAPSDVADLSNFATMFTRMQQMRVVPFDLGSFGHLLGSTLGSIGDGAAAHPPRGAAGGLAVVSRAHSHPVKLTDAAGCRERAMP